MSSAFLLLSLLAASPQQDPEPSRSAWAEVLVCPLCEGAGLSEEPCSPCAGSGEHPCTSCDPVASQRPPPLDPVPSVFARVRWAMSQGIHSIISKAGSVGPEPGRLPCPDLVCRGSGEAPAGKSCRVCEGERLIQCRDCKGKGKWRCDACGGAGKRIGNCMNCAGLGMIPVPRNEEAVRTCPWCAGAGRQPCRTHLEAKRKAECLRCNGAGKRVCFRCAGAKTVNCPSCYGTGRYLFGTPGETRPKCAACSGKGYRKCDCKSGFSECRECEGRKRLSFACRSCQDTKSVACSGCVGGGFRSWVMTARILQHKGKNSRASAWKEVALDRCDQRFERLLQEAREAAEEFPAMLPPEEILAAAREAERNEILKEK